MQLTVSFFLPNYLFEAISERLHEAQVTNRSVPEGHEPKEGRVNVEAEE